MKSLTNEKNQHQNRMEEEYRQVILDGPGQQDIPPFQLSPKVQRAIHEATPPVQQPSIWQFFQLKTLVPVAAALVVLIAGILFVRLKPGPMLVESYEIDGQGYQVVSFDPSAAFDAKDLEGLTTPALQGEHGNGEGLIRPQLGFLKDELAGALRKSLESENWNQVRDALLAQEMELPTERPKHLVISDKLVELLQTETRGAELWVTQPKASVLLFRVVE